ncbi:S1 family peptidase [Amycolatopsis solani]|uniref:S1 family peptidase n=1 Tax=Amycolatopsis solani TaxID=3028615 RepID=UPI0025AF8238|nr:serine protease [Amycolatopsis sp. MEP2-6]
MAVGRLLDAATGDERGTVFAVTDRLALTAFHCIGDRETGEIAFSRLRCVWTGHVSDATVDDGDHHLDVALLRLGRALPEGLEPIQLALDAVEHTPFVAPGRPAAVRAMPGFAVSGEITWVSGELPDGAPVMQLACRESAAALPLAGVSGAPVLIGQPACAAGVVRFNVPRVDQPELAAGAAVFATPATQVLRRWPSLPSADGDDPTSLLALVRRLATRDDDRTDAQVRGDVTRLLRASSLGLPAHEFGGAKGPIETATGTAVFVVRRDLRDDAAENAARRQLAKSLAAHDDEAERRWIGVMTDGFEWRVYRRLGGKLHAVQATMEVSYGKPDVDKVLAWLESILASGNEVEPTPREIVRRLGADSPSYAIDSTELRAIYARHRNMPEVRVKRALWAKLLTTASGTHFSDDDALFIDHTLLVLMAEVIGHAVVGFDPMDPALTAAAITSGELFTQAQIGGVIEADFFDWVVEVPGGSRFVKDLARRLTRFSWQHVEHDVMKVLYESIIPADVRHLLGEYYTPDWLAESIVDECVQHPLDERVLDASCGSGTFLFHAVRHYISAAEAAGTGGPAVVRAVTEHVVGFDVHPVAVTLARVTYLLAIGPRRLQHGGRPAFAVPVYLADSLRWGQETSLWSDDNLTIPAELDHSTFVSDATFADPAVRMFSFPDRIVASADLFDRLVAELADRATDRVRGAPVPSLAGLFRRLDIDDIDERAMLKQTFRVMCELHDEKLDHIWGYYIRNVARPDWLKRPDNRVDVLVGNPPWLSYRHMTGPQKATFRAMSVDRSLWVGGSHATNQDLSALFVARCIEQYLRPGGRFGYVMPWDVLPRKIHSRSAYEGFRKGNYSAPTEGVTVAFERPWDLHLVKPSFFPVPACVAFGTRRNAANNVPLIQKPQVWAGRLSLNGASRDEVLAGISRYVGEPVRTTTASPYMGRFAQGATVVPNMLFLVEEMDSGPLGSGAGRITVRSRRSPNEKPPWKHLPAMTGVVEQDFVRPLYRGDSILPFRGASSVSAVIPWSGNRLLDGNDDQLDTYPGLAQWWRAAEKIWERHRKSNRLSLAEQLDYRNKLSHQLPATKYRVVYAASGMYSAAAVVTDDKVIIEHQLYWGSAADIDEARFLTAFLNSETLTTAVRPLQPRGEHNPRHFDKSVFQLPIPLYDPTDEVHRRLVELAEQAERISADVPLPAKRFETQRNVIRQALTHQGVAIEIDSIVKELFA